MRVLGHVVRYRAAGEGPAAILVHGLGGSPRWWAGTVPALAADRRVIVPELPGFGWTRSGLRLDDAPRILLALMERLGAAPAALVGHSMGALACLALASRHPAAAERLTLIAPPVRTAASRILAHAVPLARTVLRLPPQAAAMVMADFAARSPIALLRSAAELLVTDHADDLAAVRAPTLILWGDRDALVPATGAAELGRLIPHSRIHVISGAGHVPMLDRPADVNRELGAFLAPA
jgi:pimeloyl-ACP methyl ester carboxylesterase